MKVGQQDFSTGNVLVEYNGIMVNCPIFMDETGDIYFVLNEKEYYFRDLKSDQMGL